MIKDKLIFNGNEKQVFSTDDPCMVIFRYKDVTTAFHGVKRARFAGKGILDNEISGLLLGYLNDNGVETHFVRLLGEREQLCRKIEIIPLEVVFHNRISGSLALKLGVEDGFKPANTILDLVFNNDELGDPLINRDQAVALGLATYQELDGMYDTVRRAADTGEIIISDEISPDTCRMWDEKTGERLDKDRFRLDLGDVTDSYRIVLERLKKALDVE